MSRSVPKCPRDKKTPWNEAHGRLQPQNESKWEEMKAELKMLASQSVRAELVEVFVLSHPGPFVLSLSK